MITQHVHDALAQVRELQQAILGRIRFHGFSGPTRAISGTMALVAAAAMATPYYPDTNRAHFIGWASVLVVSLFLNSGALLHWFLNDKHVSRDVRRLRPVLDVIPPLFVGGILTAAMVWHGHFQLLFAIWMLMFGLTNLASRHVLPRMICFVGLFYIAAGVIWLFAPYSSFTNPWPMGLIFFAGEWAGGLILYIDDRRMEQRAFKPITHEEHPHEPHEGKSLHGAETRFS